MNFTTCIDCRWYPPMQELFSVWMPIVFVIGVFIVGIIVGIGIAVSLMRAPS